MVAALSGQVQSSGNAKLRRQGLDKHRHQIAGNDNPKESVSELGFTLNISCEVSGVNVSYTGGESRTHKGENAGQPPFLATSGQNLRGSVDCLLITGLSVLCYIGLIQQNTSSFSD